MRSTTDPVYNVGCGDGSVPGGIPRTRLAWLCQTEQIERTLRLLSCLDHWIREGERLQYADRQGLSRVKAALVQQAFVAGLLSPVAYIDGSVGFAREFALDQAADIEALDVEGTKAFLHERLAALIAQVRTTRQPVPDGELAALCIEPVDLLALHRSRERPSPHCCELDEDETVQLDPEGLSLIAFEYDSATARYLFHLPLRVAEGFVPEPLLPDLQGRSADSHESSECFERAITGAESRELPLGDILRELGVDIAAVCPHRLTEKQEVVLRLARGYPDWDGDGGDGDEGEGRDDERHASES